MSREYASRTLVHYFQLVASAAGITLTSDCVAEIESIADAIYQDAGDRQPRDCGRDRKAESGTGLPQPGR